jgi:GNAT superfamily N-acetyltransferase
MARRYRAAAMTRLEIRPFSEEFVPHAGELLAVRHRAHRRAEPLLPDEYEAAPSATTEVQALWAADQASGAVALRGGRVVGYLLGAPNANPRWGENVWVELAGHAADEPEDLRDLYATAAARWFDEGRVRQYVLVPTHDRALVDAWFRVGFGQQHAAGIREVPETSWPDGVRLAEDRDLEALVDLTPLLVEHQAQSPVFGVPAPSESREEIRADILADLPKPEIGDLVVERDGRIVGAFQVVPVELSSVHSGLGRPAGAALLGWAATDPSVRGSGAGIALTEGSFAWARERGHEVMVTDWRVTNLLASRFWPGRGFRETFLRLYRRIP